MKIDSYFTKLNAKKKPVKNDDDDVVVKVKKSKKKAAVISSSSESEDDVDVPKPFQAKNTGISITSNYAKQKSVSKPESQTKKVKISSADFFSGFSMKKPKPAKSPAPSLSPGKENTPESSTKVPEATKPAKMTILESEKSLKLKSKPVKRTLEIVDSDIIAIESEEPPKAKKVKKSPKEKKRVVEADREETPKKKTKKSKDGDQPKSEKKSKKLKDITKTPPEGMETPKKKGKAPKPELTPEQQAERKAQRAASFRAFQNREAPKALGEVDIPNGPPDALNGKMFCLTGVLEFITKEDFQDFIGRHGGVWKTSVTKKTDYLIKGRDFGQTKLNKAESNDFTKIISGEDVVEMVRKKMPKTAEKEKSESDDFGDLDVDDIDFSDESSKKQTESEKPKGSQKSQKKPDSQMKISQESGVSTSESAPTTPAIQQGLKILDITKESEKVEKSQKQSESSLMKPKIDVNNNDTEMMVDKYKPKDMSKIIGQNGEKSNANKLYGWLKDWKKNMQKFDFKAGYNKGGQPNPATLKAALLSGPPGIGKTTTATLVAAKLGFNVVEYNASSMRSKKLLTSKLGAEVNNTKIQMGKNDEARCEQKSLIIMDEVDGMSGNSDRGGVATLIDFIKKSKIPIVCICNDRGHAKVRSLSNYCVDLRFYRPKIQQVSAKMQQICFKEGIKGMTGPAMQKIVEGCNNDIRQVLHTLELIKASQKRGEMLAGANMYDKAKALAKSIEKDAGLKNPFEDTRKIFSCSKQEYYSKHVGDLREKQEIFFNDYMMMPAWVFENYLSAMPPTKRNQPRDPFASHQRSIASISKQDVIGSKRMQTQNWRLLTAEATNGVILPGRYLCGGLSGGGWNGGLNFPGVWGKRSSQVKNQRLVGEVSAHTSRSMNCSSRSTFNMSYVSILKQMLTQPLRASEPDVEAAVKMALDYDMTKDDFDIIQELSVWGKAPSDFSKVDSKVKSAFTRTFKKLAAHHSYPFTVEGGSIKKTKKSDKVAAETVNSGGEESEEEDAGTDLKQFARAEKKKPAKKAAAKKPSKKK